MSSYDDIEEKKQHIIKPIISKCAIHYFSSKNIHPHVFGNEEGIIWIYGNLSITSKFE